MKAASYKILSSVMLCIAMLPLIFACYVQISEAVIHHQMKAEIQKRNLITIQVKSSQLVWITKGKEAIINGNMFDVKYYLLHGSSFTLTGLFDKDEDALFAQIDISNQKNNNDATGSTLVLKWFSCFSAVHTNDVSNFIDVEKKIFSSTIQYIFKSPFLFFETPPPKFC